MRDGLLVVLRVHRDMMAAERPAMHTAHAADTAAAMTAMFPAVNGARGMNRFFQRRFRGGLKWIDLSKSRRKAKHQQEQRDSQQFRLNGGRDSFHTLVIARTGRIFQKIIKIF